MKILNWVLLKQEIGKDVDDPLTTEARREIIASKPFLKDVYFDWYYRIQSEVEEKKQILELGSGAGFMKLVLPDVITSEVFEISNVDMVVDARRLPFGDDSLDAIVMTDVLHHIPDVELFFEEATRTLKVGGLIAMVEPWNNSWSRFIFQRFHHEPFEPESNWHIPDIGPLSGANGALPWIIFSRDRNKFQSLYPKLRITKIDCFMPFSYILSGGLSYKTLVPSNSHRFVRRFEKWLDKKIGMFSLILLTKKD